MWNRPMRRKHKRGCKPEQGEAYVFHDFKLENNIAVESWARTRASAVKVFQKWRIMVADNGDCFTCVANKKPNQEEKNQTQ